MKLDREMPPFASRSRALHATLTDEAESTDGVGVPTLLGTLDSVEAVVVLLHAPAPFSFDA